MPCRVAEVAPAAKVMGRTTGSALDGARPAARPQPARLWSPDRVQAWPFPTARPASAPGIGLKRGRFRRPAWRRRLSRASRRRRHRRRDTRAAGTAAHRDQRQRHQCSIDAKSIAGSSCRSSFRQSGGLNYNTFCAICPAARAISRQFTNFLLFRQAGHRLIDASWVGW